MAMRRLLAVGLFAFFLFISGLSVFSVGRAGKLLSVSEAISFSMSVNAATSQLQISASGVAGHSGNVTLALLALGSTQVFLIDVPVAFGASGDFTWSTNLANFGQWPAFDCVGMLSTMGSDGSQLHSAPWGLRMRRFSIESMAGVPLPAGGNFSLPLPNTTTPEFPVTWTAIQGTALNGTMPECLLFATAVPGIEGVLPVN